MQKKKPGVELRRTLGLFSITMIGVGAMIGAGIFVLTGIAAGVAGPALILAFFLNGLVALLTAMSYAELGSAIPAAGGGYLWIKKALPSANGFLGGWMSWFANAVAGSLYALGFGAYFGWLLSSLGVNFFGLEGVLLQKVLAGFAVLAFVYINYRGSSEIGLVANIVAIIKLAILGVFIISGLWALQGVPNWEVNFEPFMPMGFTGILFAMGLTFIAFEGYEIIAQTGEEAINPKKNIPKAIFLSLMIAVPIYMLIAFVSLAAVDAGGIPTWQFLAQFKELGLVEAAKQFMPFGAILLIFGGLVSTLSALNATTFSSTRVLFAMSREYNTPKIFKKIHPVTQTPYTALLLSGLLIMLMAIALPIEEVASVAAMMFLLLFLQVNVATIIIRRKYGDLLDYGFKTPLFPFLQILGILTIIVISLFLFSYSPSAAWGALLWIAVGLVVYFVYAVKKEKVEKVKDTMEAAPEKHNVIAAVGEIEEVQPIISIASAIAKSKKSDMVALHVIQIPYQAFLRTGRRLVDDESKVVKNAVEFGRIRGIRVIGKNVVSQDVPKSIVDFSGRVKCDFLIMGWKGKLHSGKIARSTQEFVLRNANCATCVIHGERIGRIKKILVPFKAWGEEQMFRTRVACLLAEHYGAKLVFGRFTDKPEDKGVLKQFEILKKEISAFRGKGNCAFGLFKCKNFVEGVTRKSGDFDLVVIGPSKEWILKTFLFGSNVDRIAEKSKCPVLLIKQPSTKIESWAELLSKKVLEAVRKSD